MTAQQAIRVRKRRAIENSPNRKALKRIEKQARIKKSKKK